jgi:hypothetical protein
VLPTIAKFPKDKRYALGQRLEDKAIDILELLLRANYSRDKVDLLKKAMFGNERDELETIRNFIAGHFAGRAKLSPGLSPQDKPGFGE